MTTLNIPDRVTRKDIDDAWNEWKDARLAVQAAIANNQTAMNNFRRERTEENKEAYRATQAAHKEAIAHITDVRTRYHVLKLQFSKQSA